MKCIHCNANSNYKTRSQNGHRCGKCRRRFAFEPRDQTPKITDEMFRRAIDDVSGHDSLYFTRSNLCYALDRRISQWKWREFIGPLAVIGFIWLNVALVANMIELAIGYVVFVLILLISAAIARAMRIRFDRAMRISPREVDGLLRRWVSAHGSVDKLLDDSVWEVVTRQAASPAMNAELREYSFERAVVTDRAQPAALLVANKFHVDNECAVLSFDGYPSGDADTVRAMLRRNPDLRVMAVHDASRAGCALPLALRTEPWFQNTSAKVIDLGLRPNQGRSMGLRTLSQSPASLGPERELLTNNEVVWLEAGKWMDLSALPPAQLMRAISQGFARFEEMLATGQGATDGTGIWLASFDDSNDGDSGESFG